MCFCSALISCSVWFIRPEKKTRVVRGVTEVISPPRTTLCGKWKTHELQYGSNCFNAWGDHWLINKWGIHMDSLPFNLFWILKLNHPTNITNQDSRWGINKSFQMLWTCEHSSVSHACMILYNCVFFLRWQLMAAIFISPTTAALRFWGLARWLSFQSLVLPKPNHQKMLSEWCHHDQAVSAP